jgi:stage II sporulation protein D
MAPQWFGTISYTEGNGVGSVEIGGISFRGTELRKLFGLRSTNIRFSVTEDKVTISTLGYGHRVGLSQYGAKAMALDGKAFQEILCHYYRNTKIKRLSL